MRKFRRTWGYVYEYMSVIGKYTISTEHIPTGNKLGRHYHRQCKEIEIVLEGSPFVNGKEANAGDVFFWKPGDLHEYDNSKGKSIAVILTISFPHFELEDEIYV